MTPQRTTHTLTAWRIGDPAGRHKIFDAEGSRLYPGRWNTPASPMIYTSEHYSTAMLEKLVHFGAVMPANQHAIRITIPRGTSYEMFLPEAHPGWDGRDPSICRALGEAWFLAGRAALFIVPSIVARVERNILIHPHHAETAGITHDLPQPIWWDERLFG